MAPYLRAMPWLAGLALLILTVIVMEAVAYALHRFVMHGPGWVLHKSHHRPREGAFEANDWYGALFALPSFLLIFFALQRGWWEGLAWIGAGIAVYGAIYFGFHDIVVHRRVAHGYVPRSTYMKRIVQAHRLHHAVGDKKGAVSFGFLWAPDPRKLKAALQEKRRARVR